MLSQLNLRFPKKLIEALKVRAGCENTSINALTESVLENSLKTAPAGDGYFQLIADPEATVRQLYRHLILGQTFGMSTILTSCALYWFMPGRPSCVGITGWPPYRPWARYSTSPATCWLGRLSTTVRWTAPT